MTQARLTRRRFGQLALAPGLLAALAPLQARAQYRTLEWDELIPEGIDYPGIAGDGFMDVENDIWRPVWDETAYAFREDLDGADITMPGYIIPIEIGAEGVTGFLLVPYVGACIHVPPPPPNQLVYVTSARPWPSEDLWEAVWISGRLSVGSTETELAEAGYRIEASLIEIYEI